MRNVILLGLLAVVMMPLTLPQQYLAVYLKINEGEQAERKQDFKGALDEFKACYLKLAAIRQSDLDWESALVLHRLDDLKAKILELQPKADAAVATNPALTAGAPKADALIFLQTHPFSAGSRNNYPWKLNVATSQFWIGEHGEKASAWVPDWVHENGGSDSPDDRNGFATGGHASELNPFYVALPFNDLANPALAQKCLPKGWARAPRNGKPISACKDRWVEMKNAHGDDCFAQWEDAGATTDEAEYVFGAAGAPAVKQPGIQVSPAVGEYLGLSDPNAMVSWRFVDDGEVRPGAWLKMDEQSVIYRAMHHQKQ